MPIYEYQCKACCHCFENSFFRPMPLRPSAPSAQCEDVQKLMSAGCVRAQGIPTGSGGFKGPACKPSGG